MIIYLFFITKSNTHNCDSTKLFACSSFVVARGICHLLMFCCFTRYKYDYYDLRYPPCSTPCSVLPPVCSVSHWSAFPSSVFAASLSVLQLLSSILKLLRVPLPHPTLGLLFPLLCVCPSFPLSHATPFLSPCRFFLSVFLSVVSSLILPHAL